MKQKNILIGLTLILSGLIVGALITSFIYTTTTNANNESYETRLITLANTNQVLNEQLTELKITNKNLLNEKNVLFEAKNYSDNQLKSERVTSKDIQEKLRASALKCYWATQYLSNTPMAITHFEGEDYTQEYIYECNTEAYNNQDLIWVGD